MGAGGRGAGERRGACELGTEGQEEGSCPPGLRDPETPLLKCPHVLVDYVSKFVRNSVELGKPFSVETVPSVEDSLFRHIHANAFNPHGPRWLCPVGRWCVSAHLRSQGSWLRGLLGGGHGFLAVKYLEQ